MSTTNVPVIFRERPYVVEGASTKILQHRTGEIIIPDHRPRYNKKKRQLIFRYNSPSVFVEHMTTNRQLFYRNIQPNLNLFLGDASRGLAYLAYGQTGSGKTFTLVGSKEEGGLIQNTLQYIFSHPEYNSKYRVCFQSLEIYNERIFDLLANRQELVLRESGDGMRFSREPRLVDLTDYTSLIKFLSQVSRNKVMGETKINKASSRSHTTYKFALHPRKGGPIKTLLYLDLAGTERGKFSVAQDRVAFREYASINQSLFSLKECIRAIYRKQSYIPYRRSKLTMILKNIFYHRYKLHFIANLNPSSLYFHDILDTIRYATSLANSNISEIHQGLADTGTTGDQTTNRVGKTTLISKVFSQTVF